MKVALISDTHWGIRGDNVKFLDYFNQFYSEVFFPYLDKHDIKNVVHLGDLVDRRKFINIYTAERMKSDFFVPMIDRGIDYHQIIGNHDTYYKTTNEVNSYMNLGVPFPAYTKATEIDFDGHLVLFVPWICDDNREHTFSMMAKTSATTVFGHLELSGFQMYKGLPSHGGMDPVSFNKFDRVFSGHYHTKSQSGNVTYLGAPCEYTWSDYNDDRGFHIFDTETLQLEYIVNPLCIFKKIVYDDTALKPSDVTKADYSQYKNSIVKVIVKNKTNPYLFDTFIDKIEATGVIELQTVEDHFNLDSTEDFEIVDESENTIDICNKYVDSIDYPGLDKSKLKRVMMELYNEALTVNG
jgi:DNA repair exonuclease SbcCD nuclease subunit